MFSSLRNLDSLSDIPSACGVVIDRWGPSTQGTIMCNRLGQSNSAVRWPWWWWWWWLRMIHQGLDKQTEFKRRVRNLVCSRHVSSVLMSFNLCHTQEHSDMCSHRFLSHSFSLSLSLSLSPSHPLTHSLSHSLPFAL